MRCARDHNSRTACHLTTHRHYRNAAQTPRLICIHTCTGPQKVSESNGPPLILAIFLSIYYTTNSKIFLTINTGYTKIGTMEKKLVTKDHQVTLTLNVFLYNQTKLMSICQYFFIFPYFFYFL